MRVFLLFLSMLVSLYAKEIDATYKISFGIFGQIGEAKASMKVDENGDYTISMLAKAEGLAKFLSGGRTEQFISRGKQLSNGLLRPDYYEHKVIQKSKENSGSSLKLEDWEDVIKTKLKQFWFNHDKKSVQKNQTRYNDDKVDDISEKVLEYYADNDLLSLFFNFKSMSKNFTLKDSTIMYAIGANKKDGRVDIIYPSDERLEKLSEDMEMKKGHFYITYINQKIFSSERGELYVNLNEEGICQKAILKDVIFFGDIRGELIESKIKP